MSPTPNSLSLVYSENPNPHPNSVMVQASLRSGFLKFSFDIKTAEPHFVSQQLAKNQSVWGLWEYDVVEVFVQHLQTPHYFEFQLSPLGQYFELEVRKPRIDINRSFQSQFNHRVQLVNAHSWQATFEIPGSVLGFNETQHELADIKGNAFAILGATGFRQYYSAFLPPQTKPDFHLPSFFRPLNLLK